MKFFFNAELGYYHFYGALDTASVHWQIDFGFLPTWKDKNGVFVS